MSEISRVALFGKLNPIAYKAIEGATVFCKMRGNPYVELVHWLVQIVQNNDTDITAILRHYQIDMSALAKDMTTALDRLPLTIVREARQGLSHARNAAVQQCSGEYILWTDDDVRVDRGWLSAYVRAIDAFPQASLFGGPITPRFERRHTT